MNKTIIATVNIKDIKMPEDQVRHLFGLDIPTHIHLFLTDALFEKMKNIQKMIKENNLTTIKTLSSYRKTPDSSYALFYRNNELMDIPKYLDGDIKYSVVDLNNFTLTCDSVHARNFSASFLYTSALCNELEVKTQYFNI